MVHLPTDSGRGLVTRFFAKLAPFARWLRASGWATEPPVGPWEVVRARKGSVMVLFYGREDGRLAAGNAAAAKLAGRWISTTQAEQERAASEARARRAAALRLQQEPPPRVPTKWRRTRAGGRLHMPSTVLGELLDAAEDAPPLLLELREIAVAGISDAIEGAASMGEAAKLLGISRATLYRYVERYPELR